MVTPKPSKLRQHQPQRQFVLKPLIERRVAPPQITTEGHSNIEANESNGVTGGTERIDRDSAKPKLAPPFSFEPQQIQQHQQQQQNLLTLSKDSSICTGISEILKNGHMVLKNNKRNNELDMTH